MQHQSERRTSVEATVFDPAPPLGIFAALGPAFLVAGVLASSFLDFPFAALGLALIFLHDLRPRRRPRTTRLSCRAGAIRIPRHGLIRARDIEGATTARVGDRVSILLAHRRRKATPIQIDVADDAALATICKSLGIGHNGFGYVDFVTQPPHTERTRYPVDAVAVVAIAMAYLPGVVGGVSVLAACAAVLGRIIQFLVRLGTTPPVIRITSAGLVIPTNAGGTLLPFHAIEEVAQRAEELVFRVRTDQETVVHVVRVATSSWARQACSRVELEHIVAQIRAAVDRAHGQFVFKPEPTLARQLERAKDEPIGDWRARIDTFGTGGAGYRGTVFDAAELWTLLEDPEATADVRTAAARILARLDRKTLRVRVADVLATVRDDEVRASISDSLDEEEPLSARPLLK